MKLFKNSQDKNNVEVICYDQEPYGKVICDNPELYYKCTFKKGRPCFECKHNTTSPV